MAHLFSDKKTRRKVRVRLDGAHGKRPDPHDDEYGGADESEATRGWARNTPDNDREEQGIGYSEHDGSGREQGVYE